MVSIGHSIVYLPSSIMKIVIICRIFTVQSRFYHFCLRICNGSFWESNHLTSVIFVFIIKIFEDFTRTTILSCYFVSITHGCISSYLPSLCCSFFENSCDERKFFRIISFICFFLHDTCHINHIKDFDTSHIGNYS